MIKIKEELVELIKCIHNSLDAWQEIKPEEILSNSNIDKDIEDSIYKLTLLLEINIIKHIEGPAISIYDYLGDLKTYKIDRIEHKYIIDEIEQCICRGFYYNTSLFWVLGKGWPPFAANAILRILSCIGKELSDKEIIQSMRSLRNTMCLDDERFTNDIEEIIMDSKVLSILKAMKENRNSEVLEEIDITIGKRNRIFTNSRD